MLILARKSGQEIRIGDIVIKVMKCGKGSMKIGVDAPENVQILRGELCSALAAARVNDNFVGLGAVQDCGDRS